MRAFSVAILSLLSTCATVEPAFAQVACGEYERVKDALEQEFGERPFVTGKMGNGASLVIFLNPKTGGFTMAIRPPGAPAEIICPAGDGTDMEPVAQGKPS